jgi:hypothetical protein
LPQIRHQNIETKGRDEYIAVMTHGLPTFVDVNALLGEFSALPAAGKLTKAIKKAMLYQSCRSDLAQAASSMDALKNLQRSPRKSGTIEKTTTEAALLTQAVILYVRATHGSGKRGERGSVQIRAKLSPELQNDHDLLARLRNRALAHVYHDEIIGNEIWTEQAILLIEQDDGGFRPCVTTRTSQVSGPVGAALLRLLPVANAMVGTIARDHLDKLVEALNQHGVSHQQLVRNQIDPTAFFGTTQRAMDVAKSAYRGEASFVTG